MSLHNPMALPKGMRFIERDWLSANMMVFDDTVIDTGYDTHTAMTLQLVQHAFEGKAPARILNTHLHSDHCGGNAILQAHYPKILTTIPALDAPAVQAWEADELTFSKTQQTCQRFTFTDTLAADTEIELSKMRFRTIATGGHDEAMLCLYCEKEGLLISADALWEDGFGVLFAQFEGNNGIAEQQATLNRLAPLDVRLVLPGHGGMFTDFKGAMKAAQQRVDYFAADPDRVWRNGMRVLIKFRLLADQRMSLADLAQLFVGDGLPRQMALRSGASLEPAQIEETAAQAAQELVRSGVAAWEGSGQERVLVNA
jgi:glyoxylase-like metal-dependent hydrolase (beta-lactamase superfamily II)